MATYYCAPKGTVSGANNGTSPTNAWNGLLACKNALATSTVSGDTIEFLGDKGPFSWADQADFPYTLNSLTGPFTAADGPNLGTGPSAGSSASGRIFDFRGSTGQAVIDMSKYAGDPAHTGSQRMYSALSIRGFGMTVLNPRVIAPNFNYLPAVPGPNSQAESISQENYGLDLYGTGFTLIGGEYIGYNGFQGFCRQAISLRLEENGTGLKLTSKIYKPYTEGAHFGLSIGIPTGSSSSYEVVGHKARSPSWGSTNGVFRTGNAGTHGGHFSAGGQCTYGDVAYSDYEGICQDSVELITVNSTFRDSVIDNTYAPSVVAWTWNAGLPGWELTTVSGVTGNGIKLGLGGYVGTSPTTWGGSDGVPGGIYNRPEFNNRALRNKISRCAAGVTSNAGNGLQISGNEIYESLYGILCSSLVGRANHWVEGNYSQVNALGAAGYAAQFGGNCALILFNNIFDGGSVGSNNDVTWATTIPPMYKNKNLNVNNRIGQTQPYPTTGDLVSQNPNWIRGGGLPLNSPLIGAGTTGTIGSTGTRTRDLHRWQRPKNPSPGCYNYQTHRITLDGDPIVNSPPQFTAQAAPAGVQGTPYSYQFLADKAATFSVASGNLPGILLSSGGLISTTFTEIRKYKFTVAITNSFGTTISNPQVIDITPADTGIIRYFNFAEMTTITDLTDAGFVFARTSVGTYFDSAGVMQTALTGQPRFTYDPLTLAARGILIEQARTNSLLNSDAPTTQTVTVTTVPWTFSFYGTGQVTFSGGYTGTLNGLGAYPTRAALIFTPSTTSVTVTITGNVTFAQFELGSNETSYIRTTTVPVTRNIESLGMNGTNFSSWYNQTTNAAVMDFRVDTRPLNASYYLAFSTETPTNLSSLLAVSQNGSTPMSLFAYNGGLLSGTTNMSAGASLGVNQKVGISTGGGQGRAALKGVAATPITWSNGPPVTCDQLWVGASIRGASGVATITIRNLTCWNVQKTSPELATLTA